MLQPGTFGYVLEMVSNLPSDQQEELVGIVRKRLSEQRRAEISRDAKEALQAIREGRGSTGTVADLIRELMEEDDDD